MMPYSIVEVVRGSRAVLESTVALGGLATLYSSAIETVDFLGGRHRSTGIGGTGGGTTYDYTPDSADPNFMLDYYVYAEKAGGLPAAGSFVVLGQPLTPATPPTFPTTKAVAHVAYSGDVLDYASLVGVFTRNNRPLCGSLRLSARRIIVGFINKDAAAQTVFRLGVYLRGA